MPGHARTLLIVESDRPTRSVLRSALGQRGYRLFEAQDGSEALEVARNIGGALHLVITDVVMPDMDGITLLRQLREGHPFLRALFVSGHCEDVFFTDPAISRKVAFLSKPVRTPALVAKVDEMLAANRGITSGAAN